jgi:hypothetical protein
MSLRSLVRSAVVALVTGSLLITVAWAGAVVVPAPELVDQGLALPERAPQVDRRAGDTGHAEPAAQAAQTAAPELGPGELLAGASKVSINPAPDEAAGEVWQTEGCATGVTPGEAAHTEKVWTESPDCIYMGGRGLGPSEPITRIDPDNGLFVRTLALSDGQDTTVLAQVDGVYWFGQYDTFCERCGFHDLAEDLGAELGIDPAGFVLAANHSHNAPDFIGGWGGAPRWYMRQVADAMRDSVREAVADLRPARLEYGEALAREMNVERRSFYRSAEDPTFTWFRAVEAAPDGEQPSAIGTVGAFSAHPVTTGYQDGTGHADWPGVFSSLVAEEFGGVGIAFVAGLGNMLPECGTQCMATGLAGLIPDIGGGRALEAPDVRSAQTFWDQPLSNVGLVGFRAGMFFDRTIISQPRTIRTGKSDDKPCVSTGPIAVRTSVSAVRIGEELAITAGPGELFANLTNTLKERATFGVDQGRPKVVTLPLSNANDGLGYIMQAFETDHAGRQVLGFTDAPAEYEDAFGLDACFGDMVVESTIGLLRDLAPRQE